MLGYGPGSENSCLASAATAAFLCPEGAFVTDYFPFLPDIRPEGVLPPSLSFTSGEPSRAPAAELK